MNTLKCQISMSQNEINSILRRITPIQFTSNNGLFATTSTIASCNGTLSICSDVDISGTEYVNSIVNRGSYTGTNISLDGNFSLTGRLANTSNSISIGYQSGNVGQKANTIAIGIYAGNLNQQSQSIAIGAYAGYNYQNDDAVAIGSNAGYSNQQASIAIGSNAGYENQAYYSIAIGKNSATTNQGVRSIAMGAFAGSQSQGSYSIAIGSQAGSNSQHTNTTILNASGSLLNSDGTNRFYVAPIRGVAAGKGVDMLCYNSTTHEIYYSTT